MPHYHISDFEDVKLPQAFNGVIFNRMYKGDHETSCWLIDVCVDDRCFFITLKSTNSGYILKFDKITRFALNFYTQQALKAFVEISKAVVIKSNVPNIIKKEHLEDQNSFLKTIDYFIDDFPKAKNISIEIGFGSGRHLIYQANKEPEMLFIGIEIHKPSIEQVIKQIAINNIENIILLNYDARIFLELIPSNSIKQIFIHFPVPWDKKPTRRVISTNIIKQSQRVLQKDAILELRTDSQSYFKYALDTFLETSTIDIKIRKNSDLMVTSKYEDRWRLQNKDIYDIIIRNSIFSAKLNLLKKCSFNKLIVNHENIKAFLGKTIMTNSGFIHFERIYLATLTNYIIRLSLGNIGHPEHLYVKIDDNRVSYIPNAPVASQANISMHNKLIECIAGKANE